MRKRAEYVSWKRQPGLAARLRLTLPSSRDEGLGSGILPVESIDYAAGAGLVRCGAPVAFLAVLLGFSGGLVEAREGFPSSPASTNASTTPLRVKYAADRMAVEAYGVTVDQVLNAVGRESGLLVIAPHVLDRKVNLTFEGLTLPEALGRILRYESYAVRYPQEFSSASSMNAHGVATLWVFPTGEEGLRASTESSQQSGRAMRDDSEMLSDAAGDDPGMTRAVDFALADEDVDTRLEAISDLAQIGGDQAAAALAETLNDPQSSVRLEAVNALGDMGGVTAIQALERALLNPDAEVRGSAIVALADIGGEQSASALAAALYDGDPELREEAVDALGEIGGETAMLLLHHAQADEKAHIREAAAAYLAELVGGRQPIDE